ncbi:hypothetical protein SAVIM338S_06769 [Streptomyces avidinii]
MFSFPIARTSRTTTLALAATAATAALSLAVATGGFATAAPAAAPAPVPAAAPAAAAAASAAAPSVSGSPEGAFTRIADFYGAYVDAVYDGDGTTSDRLRSFYLSEPLRQDLKKWEAAHHADGVLRAQNVPLQWRVDSTGNGTGRANATVTLTWGGGSTTRIQVQADLATRKIVSIKG